MTKIGEYVGVEQIVEEAGVKSAAGLQCGILVNDDDKRTTLIIALPGVGTPRYPNYWDQKKIGVLHYCGTDKGQSKSIPKQNINSRLNSAVNTGVYPIHVYIRHPNHVFRYMGEFIRCREYDEELENGGKIIYRFGLISKNIDVIAPILNSYFNRNFSTIEKGIESEFGNTQEFIIKSRYVKQARRSPNV